MDNRAGEMQVFLRVVESGSFSEAARLLGMTPSTVSKLISRVEDRLGVRLIERSTRRLSLTAEGEIYYERSQTFLQDLDQIEQELSQGAAATGGRVRVNVSVALGVLGLEPLLPEFWRAYPNIVVDLSLSDEIVDLYLDRTDIAFRVGRLPDSGMVARRIGTAHRKIVASPAYLARHGAPGRSMIYPDTTAWASTFVGPCPSGRSRNEAVWSNASSTAPCSATMARRSGAWPWPMSDWPAWVTTTSGLIWPRAAWWRSWAT